MLVEIINTRRSKSDYYPKNKKELVEMLKLSEVKGHLDLIDTSRITDMSDLFRFCTENNEYYNGISQWNTNNVQNMQDMFFGAIKFNQPIGNWNTNRVTDMSGMFHQAIVFNQPIGKWNTSKVSDMSCMFYRAEAFNQPIGKWNTTNVTYMYDMFRQATSFNQPLDNWDVSNTSDMETMFQGAISFNQSLDNWDVRKVPSNHFKKMFDNSGIERSRNYPKWCVR